MLEDNSLPTKQGNRERRAMRRDPNHSSSSRPPRQTHRGIEICRDYNEGREGHADNHVCPTCRSHVCAYYRQHHPACNREATKGEDKGSSEGKNVMTKAKEKVEKEKTTNVETPPTTLTLP
jgi:hypothetical protein